MIPDGLIIATAYLAIIGAVGFILILFGLCLGINVLDLIQS
jgi:hypothetical protein